METAVASKTKQRVSKIPKAPKIILGAWGPVFFCNPVLLLQSTKYFQPFSFIKRKKEKKNELKKVLCINITSETVFNLFCSRKKRKELVLIKNAIKKYKIYIYINKKIYIFSNVKKPIEKETRVKIIKRKMCEQLFAKTKVVKKN